MFRHPRGHVGSSIIGGHVSAVSRARRQSIHREICHLVNAGVSDYFGNLSGFLSHPPGLAGRSIIGGHVCTRTDAFEITDWMGVLSGGWIVVCGSPDRSSDLSDHRKYASWGKDLSVDIPRPRRLLAILN